MCIDRFDRFDNDFRVIFGTPLILYQLFLEYHAYGIVGLQKVSVSLIMTEWNGYFQHKGIFALESKSSLVFNISENALVN